MLEEDVVVCMPFIHLSFSEHFLNANYVTGTGDRTGNKAGGALPPGDFALMVETESCVRVEVLCV